MTWKTLFVLATIAASAFAEEFSNCTRPAGGFHNVTEVNADGSFCTMLPPYGVNNVAINEACANSYCFNGKYTNTSTHLVGPSDLILSSHYVANTTNSYVQITGCIDGSKWGLSPTDEGGQMDSHGWKYTCSGYKKFLSLLEPATNTFCIRCCNGADVDADCNTSHSTDGCWNLIPGQYTMADGSACAAPAGAPPVVTTVSGTVTTVYPTTLPGSATATVPGAATTTAAAGSSTTAAANPSSSSGSGSKGTSAGSRFGLSLESVAVAAVAVMAVAAF
ncbi:hypothetical protein BGZ80_001273 [Entomortierella chlamydospora]|uniref:Secreted protein n=1 Tax=Entomortierella chlamydospora TaxID=101097 RepID=A0A9P6N332_9FUNG|nr:hypothetical protein BGZ79_003340 [Entomortierella chlamydospora]KAG0021979.1 hypothetical protein BGZ80_001273 [Entomortierella chlamydospora]